MPIEFHCPGCGNLMRTPDKTAGKRGQCPDCKTKVQIPVASIATTGNPPAETPAAKAQVSDKSPTAEPAKTAPIRLSCSKCGQTLTVPAANAGKKGQCPHCGAVMIIQPASSGSDKKGPAPRWKGGPQPTGTIQFNCPSCRQLVKVAATAAGARGKCPHCSGVVQIPTKSTAAPAAAPKPAPRPNEVTPQASHRPAPASDPFAGLADLATPANQDPLASAAAPIVSAPSGSFGGGYGTNSYSVPRSTGRGRKIFKPSVNVSRNGLPWDKQTKPDGAFTATIKLILFTPNKAFCMMKRSGGIGRPLGFGYAGFVGGVMANVFYAAAIAGVVLLVSYFMARTGTGNVENTGHVFATYGVVVGIVAGAYLVQASAAVILGSFFNAGVHHLLLMMMDGANYSYETTYRATTYSMGACGSILFVPVIGSVILPFAYPVITILGLKNAHETSSGRAAFAVLLPYVILCGCYTGLLLSGNALSTVMSVTQGS